GPVRMITDCRLPIADCRFAQRPCKAIRDCGVSQTSCPTDVIRWAFRKSAICNLQSAIACFLFLFMAGVATAQTDAPTLPDPIPVRRLLIPAGFLPSNWAPAQEGPLRELSRKEFETQMQTAARAQRDAQEPPRLLKARYWARLEGNALTGSADWTVQQPRE